MFFIWGDAKVSGISLELRDQEYAGSSKMIRLGLTVGVWYAAILYYLLVYLPRRTNLDNKEFAVNNVS